MSGKYQLLLAFWGALFVVSLLMLLVGLQSVDSENIVLPPSPGDTTEANGGEPGDRPGGGLLPSESGGRWTLILSTISAFVSAAGFMTTTYFAARNDRRQSRLTELEITKLANEIERQRLEIDELRRAQQEQEKPQE